MITAPPPSWLEEYLADAFIRKKYFKPDTELLEDPRIFHNERLWKHDRIIVPKTTATEIIAMYHDSPSAGHWGVNRTVGLIRRRYHIDTSAGSCGGIAGRAWHANRRRPGTTAHAV